MFYLALTLYLYFFSPGGTDNCLGKGWDYLPYYLYFTDFMFLFCKFPCSCAVFVYLADRCFLLVFVPLARGTVLTRWRMIPCIQLRSCIFSCVCCRHRLLHIYFYCQSIFIISQLWVVHCFYFCILCLYMLLLFFLVSPNSRSHEIWIRVRPRVYKIQLTCFSLSCPSSLLSGSPKGITALEYLLDSELSLDCNCIFFQQY